ncbi:MAG TPA: hypothetical protein VLK33_12030 [Terriglobales bacterium]|nr:hypothetical protein [Terriglobales bacterium]
MNKIFISLLALILFATSAQSSAQERAAESHTLVAGTTIPAMLDKSVDVRKSKVGDAVIAQTTEPVKEDGEIVIPKGSKIVGRVTEAKSRTSDDPDSVLGIAFDHAVLKKGGELPLRLTIQAIAPDLTSPTSLQPMDGATPADSTGGMGPLNRPSTMGANSDPNAGVPGRPDSPVKAAYEEQSGGRTANGALTPQCHGVLGIEGLSLAFRPNDASKTPLIISQTKNVRLDGRTQLMLRVTDK